MFALPVLVCPLTPYEWKNTCFLRKPTGIICPLFNSATSFPPLAEIGVQLAEIAIQLAEIAIQLASIPPLVD